MKNLVVFVQGFTMGIAEIIPGVSGSTIAVIWGIYERFIDLLHSVSETAKTLLLVPLGKKKIGDIRKELKKIEWEFAIYLLSGMLVAIVLLANVIDFLLHEYPNYLHAFFFALILAAVLIPLNRIKKVNSRVVLVFAVTFSIGLIVLSTSNISIGQSYLSFLVGGFVGICGMLLPGVSGSFILLTLGLYYEIISILKALFRLEIGLEQLMKVLVFMLGLILGFLTFVRVLKWAMRDYNDQLMAFLAGIMLASLRSIWPYYFFVGESAQKRDYIPFLDANDATIGITLVLVLSLLASLLLIRRELRGND